MKRLLVLIFISILCPAFVPPPQAPKGKLQTFGQMIRQEEERQEKNKPQFLESLPGDLRRKILLVASKYGIALNVDALAQEILNLAATNKALREQINNLPNILAILKALPKPAAIYLVEKLAKLPVIQENMLAILQALPRSGAQYLSEVLADTPGMNHLEVKEWLKTIHLEDGEKLFAAINTNDPDLEDITRMLENPNIDINWRDPLDSTALTRAIYQNNVKIVQLLLAAGAKITTKKYDNTDLMSAANVRHKEIVELLLAAGVNVNAKNLRGSTALMMAAQPLCNNTKLGTQIDIEIIKQLIKAGADVNAQRDDDGYTALIEASRDGRIEIVETLLALGADPTIKNEYKLTALDYVNSTLNAANDSTRYRIPTYQKIAKLLKDSLKRQKEKRDR